MLDLEGNELAAARVVDTNTLPSKGHASSIRDSGLAEGAGLLTSSVQPFASVDNSYRSAIIINGQTRDHGLLVTAGGADYALVASKWTGFHPGCAGLPGVKGIPGVAGTQDRPAIPGTKGLKGVKGVKLQTGWFTAKIWPLAPFAPHGSIVQHGTDGKGALDLKQDERRI